jgi:cell division protein FtsN
LPRRRRARALVVAAVVTVVAGTTVAVGALGARWWWEYSDGSRKPVGHEASRAAAPPPSDRASWKAWLGIAPRRTAAEASPRPDRTAKAPPAAPVLTFYHDLTAPLAPPTHATKPTPHAPSSVTLPPPAPKPAPARPSAAPSVSSSATAPASRRETSPDGAPAVGAEPRQADDPNGRRFTIQVGAYRAREMADAVRTRLAGSDVYITESEGPEGVRYRVRVGSFATHEAARAAAAKLAAERQVPTYVTTR